MKSRIAHWPSHNVICLNFLPLCIFENISILSNCSFSELPIKQNLKIDVSNQFHQSSSEIQ